jgi:hypothetical protein
VDDTLASLADEIRACKACPLHRSAKQAVPGEGSAESGILFLGEAPGYNEDVQGRPFVGAAGQLLDRQAKAGEIAPRTAPLLWNRQPEQTQLAHLGDYVIGESVLLIPLGGVGLDLRLAQVARQVSDGALLVGEVELGVQRGGRRHRG